MSRFAAWTVCALAAWAVVFGVGWMFMHYWRESLAVVAFAVAIFALDRWDGPLFHPRRERAHR